MKEEILQYIGSVGKDTENPIVQTTKDKNGTVWYKRKNGDVEKAK